MLIRPRYHGNIDPSKVQDLMGLSDDDRFRLGFVEAYDICNRESIGPIFEGMEITSVDHLQETSNELYKVRRYHRYINNNLAYMV